MAFGKQCDGIVYDLLSALLQRRELNTVFTVQIQLQILQTQVQSCSPACASSPMPHLGHFSSRNQNHDKMYDKFTLLQCLCPLTPWPSSALPHVIMPSLGSRAKYVRWAGAAVSILFALRLSFVIANPDQDVAELSAVYLMGAWMVAIGSIAS
jgi:hypothetical protein